MAIKADFDTYRIATWVCRPVIVYRDPYFDQPCTFETGGKPGTIHKNCGWETAHGE